MSTTVYHCNFFHTVFWEEHSYIIGIIVKVVVVVVVIIIPQTV